MIRLFHVYFPGRTVLLAATEAMLVIVALLFICMGGTGFETAEALGYVHAVVKVFIAAAVVMLCMYYYDLYDTTVIHSSLEVLPRLVQVLGTACLVLALLYYVYPMAQLSRGPFVIWILMVGMLLGGWRKLFALLNRSSRLRQRALLLGDGPVAKALASEVEIRPHLGIQLVGYVAESDDRRAGVLDLRCLGRMQDLPELVERQRISRIILTMSEERGDLPVDELLRLKSDGIVVQSGGEAYEAITGRVALGALRHDWLLFSDCFRVSTFVLAYKRAASLAISSVGLILSSPIIALTALAIRLDSPGPVIFRQERVGKGGKPFTVFKFRSMFIDADRDGVVRPAQKNDDRVTRVGRWIRKLRIDEIPQLYNIFRGDMYFIGPRPFTTNLVQQFAKEIPFYNQRWVVKPGATGWAQVRRGYNETLDDNKEKLSYDLFYIKNLSLGLDCLILFETVKILILGRGGR